MDEEIKSLDYIDEIKELYLLKNKDIADILDYIGYILTDNGYGDARGFLEDVSELLND